MDEKMECLDDFGRDECEGLVMPRQPMSPTGKWYPRCDKHFDARMKEQERIVRTYGGKMFY